MDWLRLVLVLSLVVHGTAEESRAERPGTNPGPSDVKSDDRTTSSEEPLRHLVESLMERMERQETKLRQMEKTIEDNVEDLKRKDIRIGHLERELDEIKTASYQIQSPVDERQQPEVPARDSNPDVPLEKPKSNTNAITPRQQTEDEQPLRSVRVSPVSSGQPGVFSVSLGNSQTVQTNLVLTYDDVLLDVGGNYNTADGVYIVPVSGVYVFTWIIRAQPPSHVITELVVNGSSRAKIMSYGDSSHYDSATGLIVTPVSVGDHVFIRSRSTGTIDSDTVYGKAMFSGWRLS